MSIYSKITKIDPSKFHEITIEILRKDNYISGATEVLAERYWDAYVKVYNKLCDKHIKICEIENPPTVSTPGTKSLI